MAQAKQTKPVEKPFEVIPPVPQDFDGAVAVNREATRAIVYWQEEKKYARFSQDQAHAHLMMGRWKRVINESGAVIKSYQLKLDL